MTKKVTKQYNLNKMQKTFADEYLITGDIKHSMIYAGYSEKYAVQNAPKVMNSPRVRQYIKERQLKLDKPTIAKQEEVLEFLTSVMRGECDEDTLRGIGQGEQVIDKLKVSPRDRVKAGELLGKRYGMWTEKIDINGEVGLVKIVDDLNDDDN